MSSHSTRNAYWRIKVNSTNQNFKEWFHSQVDKIKQDKEQAKCRFAGNAMPATRSRWLAVMGNGAWTN
jgi:hypothetical protein